jgi:hypothetical protein
MAADTPDLPQGLPEIRKLTPQLACSPHVQAKYAPQQAARLSTTALTSGPACTA